MISDEKGKLLTIASAACKALGKLGVKEREKLPNPGWINDYMSLRKRVITLVPHLAGDLPTVEPISEMEAIAESFDADANRIKSITYSQLHAYHERIVGFLERL